MSDENPPCARCGGPHPFDTSVPSVRWNAVIRANGWADYLCLTCIVTAFALANESFAATLWGGSFDGLPISVRVNDQPSIDVAVLSVENTALRVTNADLLHLARGAWHLFESLLAVRDGVPDRGIRAMSDALRAAIDKAEGVEPTFHQHLERCAQCREHPFALCPVGRRLLTLRKDADAPE